MGLSNGWEPGWHGGVAGAIPDILHPLESYTRKKCPVRDLFHSTLPGCTSSSTFSRPEPV